MTRPPQSARLRLRHCVRVASWHCLASRAIASPASLLNIATCLRLLNVDVPAYCRCRTPAVTVEAGLAAMGTMDGIIDTVSAKHDLVPLIALLKTKGNLVMIGVPEHPLELSVGPLVFGGKTITGSLIGGMKDTQEMIDFAGEHNITADIELISADYVNKAMERLAKADVRYRFVIDIGNTLNGAF